MNRILSLGGLAGIFVLLFLAGMYFSQGYLRQEGDRLRHETVQSRRTQFERTLVLSRAGPPPWADDFVQQLASTFSAEVEVLPVGTPPLVARPADRKWGFDHTVADEEGKAAAVVRLRFAPPAIARLGAAHQKVAAIMLTTALVCFFIVGLAMLGSRRALGEPPAPESLDGPEIPAETRILGELAARSTRQGAELARERADRQRAEADLLLKQVLLNRSLQEKIEMGRNLHDGLVQSLYAAGLTLQAAGKAIATAPDTARSQIETGVTTINNAIREVRGYIAGLAPEKLRERTFAQSVHSLTTTLGAGRTVEFDLRIDDEAARHLDDSQLTDLLQIVREAVSNGLRHGAATKIAVRLHESDGRLGLLVQDNGTGFNPAQAAGGHGLVNIRARAERLNAKVACNSEPAGGTRLVLSFAAPPAPVA